MSVASVTNSPVWYGLPAPEEVSIKKALDLGCCRDYCPTGQLCRTGQQTSFPGPVYSPEGTRGVGLGRAHGYGFAFDDYLAKANEEITVVVQAEHIDAVNSIEEIVKVPGVDAVLIGPYDSIRQPESDRRNRSPGK